MDQCSTNVQQCSNVQPGNWFLLAKYLKSTVSGTLVGNGLSTYSKCEQCEKHMLLKYEYFVLEGNQ